MMMVGVFFLAGAPPTQFLIMLGAITGIVFNFFEPYRFQRLISFTDPWADPLGLSVIKCFNGFWSW